MNHEPLTATINMDILKAVNLAASTEETRYYLNGVLIEVTENAVRYVATNGHILLTMIEKSPYANTMTGSWIIPHKWIKNTKGLALKDAPQLELTEQEGMLTFRSPGSASAVTPIDGTFPEWRRTAPKSMRGAKRVIQQFNPDYTMVFAKFAKAMKLEAPFIHHSHETGGPCPVTFGASRDAFGIIMPWRPESPAWDREAFLPGEV